MKLIDTLFCDDIRFEVNNKSSLMGLYNDRIKFNLGNAEVKWPLPIKLCLLLRFELESTDPYPDTFEFEYLLNGKNIFKINGKIQADESQAYINFVLTVEGLPLELGHLGFSIKLYANNDLSFETQITKAIKVLTD